MTATMTANAQRLLMYFATQSRSSSRDAAAVWGFLITTTVPPTATSPTEFPTIIHAIRTLPATEASDEFTLISQCIPSGVRIGGIFITVKSGITDDADVNVNKLIAQTQYRSALANIAKANGDGATILIAIQTPQQTLIDSLAHNETSTVPLTLTVGGDAEWSAHYVHVFHAQVKLTVAAHQNVLSAVAQHLAPANNRPLTFYLPAYNRLIIDHVYDDDADSAPLSADTPAPTPRKGMWKWSDRVVDVEVMSAGGGGGTVSAVALALRPANMLKSVTLSVLHYATRTESVHAAMSRVRTALYHQLQSMILSLSAHRQLTSHHFQPASTPYPVTLQYPLESDAKSDMSNDELITLRRQWHTRLGLPMDRPLLRQLSAVHMTSPSSRTNSASGIDDVIDLGRLVDIHLLVPPSGISGGNVYTVSGSFAYYHYGQDRFDDIGWGCAYRTLQSICSWYVLNHYAPYPMTIHATTHKPVPSIPTHRDIQETLVESHDKAPSFVGSKEWIGAIECGIVLAAIGISSKTLFVPDGTDITQHVRALAQHFRLHGTPVMIGGGVLAYGLVGLHWNETTGAVRFLILDPHYVGRDDTKSVLNGGWCGWKGAELFLPDKFYNFCLPERPQVI